MSNEVFIGVDLGGTTLKVALVDRSGQIVVSTQRKTIVGPPGSGLWKDLTDCIEQMKNQAEHHHLEILAIGMGVPGTFDQKRGCIDQFINIPGWDNFPLADKMSEFAHYPVFVDNDVNVMALAEVRYGSAQKGKNILCLTLGTGVGGAILLNKKLYRGSLFAAGEIGHVPLLIEWDASLKPKTISLEALLGNNGFLNWVREDMLNHEESILHEWEKEGRELSAKLIFKAAQEGDIFAESCWNKYGIYLGIGLVGLINTLNPDLVIIGGGISGAGRYILNPLKKYVDNNAMRLARQCVNFMIASLGNDAGMIGAATLAMEELNGK